jgi:NADH dehydrogenase
MRVGISFAVDCVALLEDVYGAHTKKIWNSISDSPHSLFKEPDVFPDIQPTIALLGASGFIGSAIAQYLLLKRVPLRCSVHTAALPFEALSGMSLESMPCDTSNSESLRKFLEGQKTIIYAAGLTTAHGKKLPAEYQRANVEDVSLLVRIAEELGISRIIFLASQAAPRGAYGLSKKQGEELIRASNLDYTILKPGLVVGSRGLASTIIKLVKKLRCIPVPIGAPKNTELVDVETISKAVFLALENNNGKLSRKTYYIGSTTLVSLVDIIELSRRLLGKTILKIYFPRFLLSIGGRIGSLILPGFPLNPEVIQGIYSEKESYLPNSSHLLPEEPEIILKRYL